LSRQVAEELNFHVESYAAELEKKGVAREEALRRARIAMGSGERVREEVNQASGGLGLRAFAADMKYALRTLRRSPGFAAAALATLALGIGGVTSVFSVVNTVLLKPFAFPEPDRLVVVREAIDELRAAMPSEPVNYRHFQRLKTESKTLEDAAIFQDSPVSVSPTGEHPHLVGGIQTSPNLLHVLGVQPMLGRDFTAADAVKGAQDVAILSYAGWQQLMGGDPGAIGKSLRLSGEPVTVIGVLPAGVRMPRVAWAAKFAPAAGTGSSDTMIYLPLEPSDWDLKNDTGNYNYKVIARMRPGVRVQDVQSELQVLQRSYTQSAHLAQHLGIAVTPLARDVTSGISEALWLMFAAVAAVLLIGCVNLANLQLARAVTAERETAVRAALGASRGRLLLARLAESVVLAAAGGAAGVGLAFTGVRLLIALAPANVPRLNEVRVSWPVLAFAAGVSIISALVFGALPAMRSLRVRPQAALQANTNRAANTKEGHRARSILVASQVGCTVVLLMVTALMLRSFSRLVSENRGFDAGHVTMAVADLYSPLYDDTKPNFKAAKLDFADRVMAALRALPGVQSAALTSAVPMAGETWVDDLTRPDHPVPVAERPQVNVRFISPEYFATMGIPLVKGHSFTQSDRSNPNLVMISERTAREAFGNEDPVGKKIISDLPDGGNPATIVGVVADTRINGLKDTAAMVYMPYWGFTPWTVSFLVRSAQPASSLPAEMQKAIWRVDPTVAIPEIKPMDEQVSDSVAAERFQTMLLSTFGGAALLLALLGIYGVLAYSVSLRRQEFGIRMALGSGRGALMGLVLRQAARPVLIGAVVGIVAALPVMRWIRSLLYETPMLDPVAIAGSLVLLLVAAALAATLPARRAAMTDPARAIRYE